MTMYVPYLTSPAACLTRDNWYDLGVTSGVGLLSQLVIKPGLSFWQQGIDLSTYLAWDKDLILDASDMQVNVRSEFVFHSPYDGSRYHLSIDSFWELVQQLNPDSLLLPPDMDVRSCGKMRVYRYGSELQSLVYVHASSGWLFLEGNQTLYASDQPARDAVQGIVYSLHDASFSILDTVYATDFQILSAGCKCSTCQQSFTRAYIHHLLQTTPLLCQRLLVIHNAYTMLLGS